MNGKTALVLGATGGIGGAVAERLVREGWTVRALHRDPGRIVGDARFTWIRGDAMVAQDVAAAAAGCALIVHAVNPPGYRNWGTLVLPMLENCIAAARPVRARIVLPGTVYNYGPDVFPDIDEAAPQHARTRKGKIRVAMEDRLRLAAKRDEARVLIVRAGDYFGPGGANNWFGQALVKPGMRPTVLGYPGKRGVGHQWAYLPDVADTMARLVALPDLPDFTSVHMAGHWDADGTQMLDAIRRALGDPTLKARPLPWGLFRLASPFVPLLRELMEMRYLWRAPVRLRGTLLEGMIGAEPHTPLDRAVRATLVSLGCMPAD